jgi:hypothetical protein
MVMIKRKLAVSSDCFMYLSHILYLSVGSLSSTASMTKGNNA